MSQTTEIIICSRCKGIGIIENSELEDYHKGEYRYWNTVCEFCNGTGRQQVETINSSITPYDDSKVKELIINKLKEKA